MSVTVSVVVRSAPLVADTDKEDTKRSGGPMWIAVAFVLFDSFDSGIWPSASARAMM